MQTMIYSEAGLAMTKSFEGLRLEAYQDVAGVWTVGYGHTGPELLRGMKISEADATALLRADLSAAVRCVNAAVRPALTQGQFDALVDFAFNVGTGAFLKSSLLRYVNAGDFPTAAAQLLLWVNAGGQRCDGLVRRRTAEQRMFCGNAVPKSAG